MYGHETMIAVVKMFLYNNVKDLLGMWRIGHKVEKDVHTEEPTRYTTAHEINIYMYKDMYS